MKYFQNDWEINLNSNWCLESQSDSTSNFEYFDKSKSLFVRYWIAKKSDSNSVEQVQNVLSFEDNNLKKLDYEMFVVRDEIINDGNRSCGLQDRWNADRKFRIFTVIISNFPIQIRFCFHDYFCESILDSQKMSNEILDEFVISEYIGQTKNSNFRLTNFSR